MNYSPIMEFEWDEAKSEACFAERGFDFAVRPSGSSPRTRLIDVRFMPMKMQSVKIDPNAPATWPEGRIDKRRVDATTEQDIERQQWSDDAESMQDAARFARHVPQATRTHPIGVLQTDRCIHRHHTQLGTRQTSPNRGSQGAPQGAGQGPRGGSLGFGLTHQQICDPHSWHR